MTPEDLQVLERLRATIALRKAAGDASTSHTARLIAKGPQACAQKFGEEAVEAVIAAVSGDEADIAAECADVIYHMMVMLAVRDMDFAAVCQELVRREGVSGLAEKAARPAEAR